MHKYLFLSVLIAFFCFQIAQAIPVKCEFSCSQSVEEHFKGSVQYYISSSHSQFKYWCGGAFSEDYEREANKLCKATYPGSEATWNSYDELDSAFRRCDRYNQSSVSSRIDCVGPQYLSKAYVINSPSTSEGRVKAPEVCQQWCPEKHNKSCATSKVTCRSQQNGGENK